MGHLVPVLDGNAQTTGAKIGKEGRSDSSSNEPPGLSWDDSHCPPVSVILPGPSSRRQGGASVTETSYARSTPGRTFAMKNNHRIRRYFYDLLHSPEIDSRVEYWVRVGIASLISLNVIIVMLETVHDIAIQYHTLFRQVEFASIVIFAVEYLLRIWSVVEAEGYRHPLWGRLRYAFTLYALIDFVAIFPFFLPHILGDVDLVFLRGLRLLRLTAVLKLGRYSTSLGMLIRVYRRKRDDLLVSMAVIMLILLLASSLMYYLEHLAQPDAFPNMFAALWWGMATLTTVGYGDVYPITPLGKICASIISLLGIGLVALPSGLLVAGFVEELESRGQKRGAGAVERGVESGVEPGIGPGEGGPNYCPHCGHRLK